MRNGIKFLLISLLGLLCFSCEAQNLVPNSSFENLSNCPSIMGQLYLAPPWFICNINSPDLFNTCCTSCQCSIPSNIVGFQFARNGFGMAGIQIQTHNDKLTFPRDYLECTLISPLLKDTLYWVSFFVNYSEEQIAIAGLGCFLSNTILQNTIDGKPFHVTPQIVSNQIIKDTINWTEISGVYKANGGEQYITIGNFDDDSTLVCDTLHFIPDPNANYNAYYFIDDVSVTQIPPPVDTSEFKPIFPNAFTPNSDGRNDYFHCLNAQDVAEMHWQVYNRWGEKIFESTDANHYWFGTYQNNPSQGESLPIGVYVWVAEYRMQGDTDFKLKSGNVTIIK